MAMQTAYIGPLNADLNDQTRETRLEIRVEESEAYAGHLALSVNTLSTGKELVLLHLDDAAVADLSDAIDAWHATQKEA